MNACLTGHCTQEMAEEDGNDSVQTTRKSVVHFPCRNPHEHTFCPFSCVQEATSVDQGETVCNTAATPDAFK